MPVLAKPITVFVALAAMTPASRSAMAADGDALPSAQVIVVRASNACFTATVPVTGFFVARKEAIVNFETPADKLTEVLVAAGDRVNSGQTLARLTRPRPSPDGRPSSETVTANLKAPAAGTVTRSTATVGAAPSAMQREPLFQIAVDGEIELEAEVPSIHVPELAPGQTARVQVSGGPTLTGRVRLTPAAIDQTTQLGRARISVERDPQLRFGMFARATIDANRSCGVSVPRSAVTYRTAGASLQVVRGDVIETRRVQVGLHSDSAVEIREGLSAGEIVVANAGTTLRDGDKVNPTLAAGPGAR